jgi:hypothetical protein
VSRPPKSIDDVTREVRRVVQRQKAGSPKDLSRYGSEIDELLGSLSEFEPVWREIPCVHRVARIRIDGGSVRVDQFADNVVLPDVKHTLELVIEMLNHIRRQRGLDTVRMPIFLQPDEIALGLRRRQGDHIEGAPARVVATESSGSRHGTPRLSKRSQDKLRRAVLVRDDYRCTRCRFQKDLHLRHREGDYADDDPEAYVTLCRRCYLLAEGAALTKPAAGDGHEDESDLPEVAIRSQLVLVFQKGRINWVGFVFGRDYVVLKS